MGAVIAYSWIRIDLLKDQNTDEQIVDDDGVVCAANRAAVNFVQNENKRIYTGYCEVNKIFQSPSDILFYHSFAFFLSLQPHSRTL